MHTNRLINETSPYLLQHAHNPVDWYPWGEEAFRRAREEDKPVFLSIGYSACHWCHVMERESFENQAIAEIINREFVAIKVDREERPDVDSIYMQAVQLMTGHGGWPMSMFLTPEGLPFYGGTYFPPDDGRGMPGFRRVLTHVAHAYKGDRQGVTEASTQIREAIQRSIDITARGETISRELLDGAAAHITTNYDAVHGGFGGAPKFPPSMSLEFLMQVARRTGNERLKEIIVNTLTKMARGGIYDQVGGGFHRYSVDARWLVPHFEKMLYDNALLARLYIRAWQWTKNDFFKRIATETLGFVAREMLSPAGGFYSTLDADSEGVEGKFYVWTRAEVMDVLGSDEGRIFCALYDITERGNWEGHSILNTPRDPRDVAEDLGVTIASLTELAARGKCKLYGRREERIRPGRDEKILAGWNGWMLAAFAEAALAFDSESFHAIVRKNADFLLGTMVRDGRLYRSTKDGITKIDALLEDYSGVAWGLVAAFEATQDRRYLDAARDFAVEILARFEDRDSGGFFDTADDHEKLIARPKDVFDNATPSGTSLAADVLLRLGIYFGEAEFTRAAHRALQSLISVAAKHPSGFGYLLAAAELQAGGAKEIVLTGSGDDEGGRSLMRVIGTEYVPHRLIVTSSSPDLPLMDGKAPDQDRAYVCSGYVCREPVSDPDGLRKQLRS